MISRMSVELPAPPPLTDEDRAFVAGYDPRAFPPIAVTVDIVILTIDRGELCVLLVRRGGPPYRGLWALPGGFVREREDLVVAAARELHEETAIGRPDPPAEAESVPGIHLEQLGTYGAPERDPGAHGPRACG